MKLIKRIEQLEHSERVEKAVAAGIAIAWSTDEERESDLADDEVAMDIHILSNDLGTAQWRTVERRRRDAQDLGDVFDAAGVRIGRVTERDGSLWSGWRWRLEEFYICSPSEPLIEGSMF